MTLAHWRHVMQAKLSERHYHNLRCTAYLGFLSQISVTTFQSDAASNLTSWFSVFNFTKNIKQAGILVCVFMPKLIIVLHNIAKLLYQYEGYLPHSVVSTHGCYCKSVTSISECLVTRHHYMTIKVSVCVVQHATSDHLSVCTVDVGETDHRTVVTATLSSSSSSPPQQSELTDRLAVLLCNVKPTAVRGVESQALLLTAYQRYWTYCWFHTCTLVIRVIPHLYSGVTSTAAYCLSEVLDILLVSHLYTGHKGGSTLV